MKEWKCKYFKSDSGVKMRFKLNLCICARTTARIWRNTNKESTEQGPKMRQQTKLPVVMHCFA